MTKRTEADFRHELEERLRFETLLTDVSSRYINLPVDRIDANIENDQRRICECLGLDLSSLWQWSANSPRFLTVTHLYSPPEGPARPEGIDAQKSFPWVLQKMLDGETLAYSTEDMAEEAAIDQESRRHFGIKSSVNIPLSVGGGQLIGVLTFDTLREERDWPAETVKRLILVAQIFSNALVRKESDRILRENEARLSMAADSAGAGLWELNLKTNLLWATERALAIFGYAPGEVINMERFEQLVFPGDLERVRQVIAGSLERNEPLSVEYRIMAGDDRVKWIYSSGRPYFKPDGEPDRLMGISIDITERKIMEERLRESEIILRNNQKDLKR
ncbi:MAG: PAS domain-containing protein, partial [Nitrospiraceae bacterium]